MNIPLLIGGATTSRIHTAVKIDPVYDGPVVHVLDASRSVPVVSELISDTAREKFIRQVKSEYSRLRNEHESRTQLKDYILLEEARKNKVKIDWDNFRPVRPSFFGVRELVDFPLSTLRNYIDWTPFFQTWMLSGKYPDILSDEAVGVEAKNYLPMPIPCWMS